MASGFGYTGGRSRCHAFWQDFQKCYASADAPEDCKAQADDYVECLHHKKEIARAMQIKTQYLNTTAHEIENKRKEVQSTNESGILGLGLLRYEPADEDEAPKGGDDSSSSDDKEGEAKDGEGEGDGDDGERQV